MARQEKRTLDESHFVRAKLHGGTKSLWRRYAELVLGRPTLLRLLRYELITMLGPLPGALGLVLRKIFYPYLFASAGKGVVFGRSLSLRHPDRIHLGDQVVLDDYCLLDGRGAESGIVLGNRVIVNRGASIQAKVDHIHVGEDTVIGADAKLISQGPIEIGRSVSIAGGASIVGGRYVVEQEQTEGEEKRRFTGGPIRIGDHCRIGIYSIVQDGVSIGDGAIVTPSSVVISDVEDHAIVTGNPARKWRSREPSDQGTARAADWDSQSASKNPQSKEPVVQAIAAYLEEELFADFTPGNLSGDDSLFDHGIIDSVSLVNLVLWLESEFGIKIPHDEVTPENFNALDEIAALVVRKQVEVA